MERLVALPVVMPLLAAGVSVGLGRWRWAQRVVTLSVLSGLTVAAAALTVHVDRHGIIAVQAGGWRAPIGITLVVDRLSGLLLTTSLLTLLAVALFAVGEGKVETRHVGFHPLYLILTAGVSAALITGDLFNLFVAFEVMLMASYVLITLGGSPEQVRRGMTYVVINLIASTLLLAALAYAYGATGTVNMADLHGRIALLPGGVQAALAVLLVVVFGSKAAVFPLFSWLPDSYPTASAPVVAVFAGLLTKVGVYTLMRSQFTLFTPSARPTTLLAVVAGLTMVVGVLGAVAQADIGRLLSFHIVSQIGYMIMGLAIGTLAGVAAAIYFTVHQMLVKSSLFLVGGMVEARTGTTRLGRLGGLASREPVLAVLFLLPALSLAGLPPLSGFVGKLALVKAGVSAGATSLVVVALAVSLLTLFSMTKIWAGAFWGAPPAAGPGSDPGSQLRPDPGPVSPARWAAMSAATGILVVAAVAVAVFAGPLYGVVERAGADLIDPSSYVAEVLGR